MPHEATMKIKGTILLVIGFVSTLSFAAQGAGPDRTQREIEACLQRGDGSLDTCKRQTKKIDAMIAAYEAGDKSALPALFKLGYLTDFYGDALIANANTFLAALAELPVDQRERVENSLGGGFYWLKTKERFEAIRVALQEVPNSSPEKALARVCLTKVETQNAGYLETYFPPETFSGRSATVKVFGLSSALYGLGQKPLWASSAPTETSYRVIYIGTLLPDVKMVRITRQSGGAARVEAKDEGVGSKPYDETRTFDADEFSNFLAGVEKASFWEMPTERRTLGLDGAEWVLEGSQNGKYHVVVRWCPGVYDDDTAFADALRSMFKLAGHRLPGGC